MKLLTTAAALLFGLQIPAVQAQAACNSDGAAPPQALVERFISADCADCWADAQTLAPGASAAVLDWIVPSAAGEQAALSSAARRDATERLAALKRAMAQATDIHISSRAPAASALPGRFRVALGPAVNDYVSALVSYQGRAPASSLLAHGGLGVWLALVEQIPAGVENTAVPRNLVRGLFHTQWQQGNQLGNGERRNLPADTRWIDRVAMQLPAGTAPQRLALIGWVQAKGDGIVGMAQAVCSQP